MSPSKPQALDSPSIQALVDILNITRSTGEGVDAVNYRAQHEDQRTLLDKLEREEYLRKKNEKYWVTLTGLTVVSDQHTMELLERCDRIIGVRINKEGFYMPKKRRYPYTKQQLVNVVKRIGKDIDPVDDYALIDRCLHKCFNKDIRDDKKPIRGWHNDFVDGQGIAVEIGRQMSRYIKAMRHPNV